MSTTLSFETWSFVTSNAVEISRLLNVVDEQDFLQEHMPSASLKECIECGDSNLARVQLLVRTMLTDDNVSLYNALGGYFLDRSEAYKAMYQLFSGIDLNACYDRYTQMAVLQDQVAHLTAELKCMREIEPKMNERLDCIQKESHELKKEVQVSFQKLQTSLVTGCDAFARSSPFPKPYSDELRLRVNKASLNYWQGFTNQFVPFLCDENGEYFVDWDKNDEQWRFFKYGKPSWNKYLKKNVQLQSPMQAYLGVDDGDFYYTDNAAVVTQSDVNLLACSLVLPRQFNASGLNDRVVNVFLSKKRTSLVLKMTHHGSPSAHVTSSVFICHFHLTIKHIDGTSLTELRGTMQCQVNNSTSYPIVFQSDALKFPSFSNTAAPNLRLTLVPL